MRLFAEFCFSGDFPECDPELAVELVRAAGYQVFKMPPSLRAEFDGHPLDDFYEAVTDGPPGSGYVNDDSHGHMTPEASKIASAIMREINALVHRHGGSCHTCGPIDGNYTPFAAVASEVAERRRRPLAEI
jgi:hypothetical protein